MHVDQENVSKILAVLSHPIRREILSNLSDKGECSFTDLMKSLNIDTGKLSFHIRSLTGLIEQSQSGKYKLSKVGENANRMIKDLENWAVEAEVARKTSLMSMRLASFKKRTYAFLIDFAIAFAVLTLASNTPSAVAYITTGSSFYLDINLVLFLVFFWIYLTLLEGFAGQSIGKRVVGLTVVRIDGKRLFYDHAAVRNLGKVFLLPFDLLIGLRLKDSRFMRYFDKFSGTTVIDLRPGISTETSEVKKQEQTTT